MGEVPMAPVNPESPLMQAWKRYTATPEFANTLRWATDPEHAEGSLWAAFSAGFAPTPATPAGSERLTDEEREALTPIATRLFIAGLDPAEFVAEVTRQAIAAVPRLAARAGDREEREGALREARQAARDAATAITHAWFEGRGDGGSMDQWRASNAARYRLEMAALFETWNKEGGA